MRIDALNHVSRLYQQSKPTKNVRTEKKYAKDEFQISQTAKDYQIAAEAICVPCRRWLTLPVCAFRSFDL